MIKEEQNKRKSRAKVWKGFMKKYLFTQVNLANALGISRRSVQYVISGEIAPHKGTDEKFRLLMQKYHSQAKEKVNA